MSTNKEDLEKRLQSALFEKDTLCGTLDEALARIHTLERHVKEQESVFEVIKLFFYIRFMIYVNCIVLLILILNYRYFI